jgi:hypothetical protein
MNHLKTIFTVLVFPFTVLAAKSNLRTAMVPKTAHALAIVLIPLIFASSALAAVTPYKESYGTFTITTGVAPVGGKASVKIAYQWDDGLSDWENSDYCPYNKATYKTWKITIKSLGDTKAVLTGSGGSGTVSTQLAGGAYTLFYEFEYERIQPPCGPNDVPGKAYGTRNEGFEFSVDEEEPAPPGGCSARVSSITGSATFQGAPLTRGTVVKTNGVITTQPGSRVELTTPDGWIIRIGGGSKLELRAEYCTSGRGFSWYLMFGKVWSKITGFVGGTPQWEMETTNAAVGVRGTTWCTEVGTKDGRPWTRVRAIQNSVTVRSLNGGQTVVVPAGKETTVTGTDAPTAPKRTPPFTTCN